jgi:hypothetical protein
MWRMAVGLMVVLGGCAQPEPLEVATLPPSLPPVVVASPPPPPPAPIPPPAPKPAQVKAAMRATDVAVPVPSDTKATYTALRLGASGAGRTILTRRDGPSGRSFTLRECTCPVSRYRNLGHGDTLQAALGGRGRESKMSLLHYDPSLRMGSVSWHVCEFACRN